MADLQNACERKDFGEEGREYLSMQRNAQVTDIVLLRVWTIWGFVYLWRDASSESAQGWCETPHTLRSHYSQRLS